MGIPSLEFHANDQIWRCNVCATHLANASDLMSEEFRGERGAAKLFASVINYSTYGRRKARMTTGDFIIEKIRCRGCESYVGWTYLVSYSASEEYKVGKFILEVAAIELRQSM